LEFKENDAKVERKFFANYFSPVFPEELFLHSQLKNAFLRND
jgi:hypothetical protein